MRKIPTLFVRNPEDRKHLLRDVTPGCEWVITGQGTATRKYDGTCTMTDGVQWWVRREVKPGKQKPPNFVEVETDSVTGKTVGWEPAEQSGFWKFVHEAIIGDEPPGTYELCGPKINGNPEDFTAHVLVRHGLLEIPDAPRSYDELGRWLLDHDYEGIVWHHADGRMCKIKKRDYE